MVRRVLCSGRNSHSGFGVPLKRLLVQSQASSSRETEKALCGSFVVSWPHLVLHDKTIEIHSPVIQIQRWVQSVQQRGYNQYNVECGLQVQNAD